METGVFTNRVAVPKHITEDERYMAHFAEKLTRGLVANMQPGVSYFTWLDEVRVYDKDHAAFYGGGEHSPDCGFRFYDESERVLEARGVLLLVDWSKCEIGDATIGRPEWVDWRLSTVTVSGPDGGLMNWRFRAERGIGILPYVNIWRRVT
jgi:hypothetical protein